MTKKNRAKASTRADSTSRGKRDGKGRLLPGNSGNPDGRPNKRSCFTDTIRAELTKRKKFRRQDGSIMEASELELIALKVIRELRTSPELNPKLLNIILDRIEGKPKESVEIDGKLELAQGIDAKNLLLQRLDNIIEKFEKEETG